MSLSKNSKLPKSYRWFVVTQWNVDCDYLSIMSASGGPRYVAYGLETCPKTGRPHHQAFVYFSSPRGGGKCSCNKIGDLFGPIHCFAQGMKGSIDQNVDYSTKATNGVLTEFGNKPAQGKPLVLDEVRDRILAGETVDELALEVPWLFHQYGRTLSRIEQITLRKQFRHPTGTHRFMTEGIWYTGPTGSGKSHSAFQNFSPETHYVKNINEDWWDGYVGQETVIINEFRAQISFSEILDLVDKWPKNVKWRNRESVPFLAKTVIITSILTPEQCYHGKTRGEDWAQFHRRFTVKTCDRSKSTLDQWVKKLPDELWDHIHDYWVGPFCWTETSLQVCEWLRPHFLPREPEIPW